MFNRVDYIILMVSDMQRSVEFYRDKLGLTLKFQSPEWAEFLTGSTTLALHPAEQTAEASNREASRRNSPGACSIGFLVDKLDDAYQTLSGKGVDFTTPPTKGGGPAGRLAVCTDPDGVQISLSEKRG